MLIDIHETDTGEITLKTLLTIMLVALTTSAWADKPKHYLTAPRPYVTENTNVTEVTSITTEAAGVAMAIASGQHQFSWSTDKWQSSVSAGSWDDETAGSVAMGKRFKGFLFNGSAGRIHGENAYGVAAGWRW